MAEVSRFSAVDKGQSDLTSMFEVGWFMRALGFVTLKLWPIFFRSPNDRNPLCQEDLKDNVKKTQGSHLMPSHFGNSKEISCASSSACSKSSSERPFRVNKSPSSQRRKEDSCDEMSEMSAGGAGAGVQGAGVCVCASASAGSSFSGCLGEMSTRGVLILWDSSLVKV